jgi:predicted ribosome quality control (RQC) complex YloA/Tae2 family protein
VEPLLEEVVSEINYLEQVRSSLSQLENYSSSEDLQALDEIQEELIQQKYLESNYQRNRTNNKESEPMRFTTPSGVELWIGRNNRQNDRLTFRSASDYDIWFHSQEIAGSHVLLRLTPVQFQKPPICNLPPITPLIIAALAIVNRFPSSIPVPNTSINPRAPSPVWWFTNRKR